MATYIQLLSTHMKTYKFTYRVIAIIFTLLLLWLVVVGFASQNYLQVGISLLICFLLWIGALKAGKDNIRDLLISCSIPAVISLPIAYRLFERVYFISTNGGMERADGYGSPLAFLIGLSFELVLFIPMVCLFLVGLRYLIRGARSYA